MVFDAAFFYLVSFVVFVALAFKPLKRALLGGLDGRISRIRRELEEATRLKEEAQALLVSFQRNQKQATDEVNAIVAHANAEAQRITTEAAARLNAEIAKRTELASAKIAQLEDRVAQELRDAVVESAISEAREQIKKNSTPALQEALVRQTLSDVSTKFH